MTVASGDWSFLVCVSLSLEHVDFDQTRCTPQFFSCGALKHISCTLNFFSLASVSFCSISAWKSKFSSGVLPSRVLYSRDRQSTFSSINRAWVAMHYASFFWWSSHPLLVTKFQTKHKIFAVATNAP